MSRQTKFDIYDRTMLCAEEVHAYVRATQAQTKALNDRRARHHQDFDDVRAGSASTDSAQHRQPQRAAQPPSE